MMKLSRCVLLLWCSTNCLAVDPYPYLAVCHQPVANVWTEQQEDVPTHSHPLMSGDLPHLETQILFGDYVEVTKETEGWCFVKVLEQRNYDAEQKQLKEVVGWVRPSNFYQILETKKKNLAVIQPWGSIHAKPETGAMVVAKVVFGAQLLGEPYDDTWFEVRLTGGKVGYIKKAAVLHFAVVCSQKSKQGLLVSFAKMFLGSPYCWGGCSAWDNRGRNLITSFDSSGLVYLCYKALGIAIPRNVHSQFECCTPVEPSKMQPGDLVFFACPKSNYTRVTHVAMYVGDGMLIEATGKDDTEKKVRMVKDTDLFDVPLYALENNEIVKGKKIFCGTFIK